MIELWGHIIGSAIIRLLPRRAWYRVADVLLPLDQIETVARGARASDVELICANTGYSRFPVVGEDGGLVGYLHIKDVLQSDPHGRARMVEDKLIRPFAEVRRSADRARPRSVRSLR